MAKLDRYWYTPLFVGTVMLTGMVSVGVLGAIVTQTWVPLIGVGIAVTSVVILLAVTFGLCALGDRLFDPKRKGD